MKRGGVQVAPPMFSHWTPHAILLSMYLQHPPESFGTPRLPMLSCAQLARARSARANNATTGPHHIARGETLQIAKTSLNHP